MKGGGGEVGEGIKEGGGRVKASGGERVKEGVKCEGWWW